MINGCTIAMPNDTILGETIERAIVSRQQPRGFAGTLAPFVTWLGPGAPLRFVLADR